MNNLIRIALIALVPFALHCDISKEMNKWFTNMDILKNTNTSSATNDDLGINFLGGTGVVRTKVRDVNPVHISFPKLSGGCGGINYALGAINVASKEEMLGALKSIMTNGAGYAFLLGLETVSPVVASTIKEIQNWANQLNSININSCEIASSLLQGVWPRSQNASQFICSQQVNSQGKFSDLIKARHGCSTGAKEAKLATETVRKDNNLLIGNYNIAWSALQKIHGLDEDTKNLFLNITGTVVVEEGSAKVYTPRLDNVFDILLFGGEIQDGYEFIPQNSDTIYAGVTTGAISIAPEDTWLFKVRKTLNSIEKKIRTEGANTKGADGSDGLSTEESNLLKNTTFPIASLTSLMAQWGGEGASLVSLDESAKIIAFELVTNYLREVLLTVIVKAESLSRTQVHDQELRTYIAGLEKLHTRINEKQNENYQKMALKWNQIKFLLEMDKYQRNQGRNL